MPNKPILTIENFTKKFVHAFGINYYKRAEGTDIWFNVAFQERKPKSKVRFIKAPSTRNGLWTDGIMIGDKYLKAGDKVNINGEELIVEREDTRSEYFSKHGKFDHSKIAFTLLGTILNTNTSKAKVKPITYTCIVNGNFKDISNIKE